VSEINIGVVGENVVDLFKIEDKFETHPGGSPLNIAVGLARLDENVSYITKFSYDFFGDMLKRTLKSENVDLSFSSTDEKLHTTLAFAFVDENKIPTFEIWNRCTADGALGWKELSKVKIESLDAVAFGSILLATPAAKDVLKFVERSKEAGKFIAFDPNYRSKVSDDRNVYIENLIKGWRLSDIVKCSIEDAKAIFGLEDLESIFDKIRELKIMAVVTNGEKGAYVVGEEIVHIPTYKTHVIDTTGCGDAFMAGMIHKLAKKGFSMDTKSIVEAAKFGSATAAMAAQKIGAITSFPKMEDVKEFLKDVN
jgi:fructokinase